MRIFNEEKTAELTDIDFEKGYLKSDKLIIAHHDATPYKKGRTAQEIAEELKTQGIIIEVGFDDKLYRVVREYECGGRDTELIKDEPDTLAQEAYDDYEDIQVYIPYTEEELKAHSIALLRARRESECFSFINRGQLWYDNLTDEQRTELKDWYNAWLDVTETLTVPEKPEWLN